MNTIPTLLRCDEHTFGTTGGVRETTVTMQSFGHGSIADHLERLNRRLSLSLDGHGLGHGDIVFLRLFLEDTAVSANDVSACDLIRSCPQACISVIGQTPLAGCRIALYAYCLEGTKVRISKTTASAGTVVDTGDYQFMWTGGLRGGGEDSHAQTQEILDTYESAIRPLGCQLNPDLIRTWIYVNDVDRNYEGMVRARRDLFEKRGLRSDTNYVASTGIGATFSDPSELVGMDALTVKGLNKEQVVFLQAPENMCPTHVYNVTFERGTKVAFGDREHLYVSGTASIDTKGEVLHVGDVVRQTERTLDNVEALVSPQGCGLADFSHLFIYLRNPEEYDAVSRVVDERVPSSVPRLYLHGPVCRPTWLVEVEGVAVKPATHPYPNF